MIDVSSYSFENILQRMLGRISDDFDKTEGSIIYDALAPAAYELAECYEYLASSLEQCFVPYATGEFLDSRVEEMGLSRKAAVKAVRRGQFLNSSSADADVEIGARFGTIEGSDSLTFAVIEKLGSGLYLLECEEAGSVGNSYTGNLLPVDYIEDLSTATLYGEAVISGSDEEDDESLRQRYYENVGIESQGWNVAQYEKAALNFDGIGRVRVFPCYDGANTVQVSILSKEYNTASTALINKFQEYLDPDGKGLGNGEAPIGAIVTVSTPTKRGIKVACTVSLADDATLATAKSEIQAGLKQLFKDVAYVKNTVSYLDIGAVISNVASVDGVTALTVNNGTTTSITLGQEEIPYLLSLTVEVAE